MVISSFLETSSLILGILKQPSVKSHSSPVSSSTVGLINTLLKSFNSLIENGHSIIVVEHNIDLIKSSDHIIDLGLDGGKKGGNLIFQGTPEQLARNKKSYTAKYLAEKLTF